MVNEKGKFVNLNETGKIVNHQNIEKVEKLLARICEMCDSVNNNERSIMFFILLMILVALCYPKAIGLGLKLALGVGFLLLAASIF